MNQISNNIKSSIGGNDVDSFDISENSFALAKNLRNHLGYERACETCKQNHWNGVLSALNIINRKNNS